jgi:alpha-1,2-mannosyltransferase
MPGTLSQPTTNSAAPACKSARWALIIAIALWIIPTIVISIMVAHRPNDHTVSGSYHLATHNWYAGKDIYNGPQGMNYFPQFVMLYTPFHFLPLAPGEVLWRLVALATIATGVWKMVCTLFPNTRDKAFLLASVLTIPLSLGAVRNANSNALFGGVILWAVIAILEERWRLAAVLTILSIMVKPLGLVLFLLAPLYYAKMRLPLIAGLVAMLIVPFLFGKPDYVWSQHKKMVENLRSCSEVTQHRFADIHGILRTFKVEMPPNVSMLVRVIAGAITAVIWWWGARRLNSTLRALWLFALTTAYLMLFNPMTEANSYSILAPALAVWTCVFVFGRADEKLPQYGWLLACMTVGMGVLPSLLYPVFGNYFALIWHPVMAIEFLIILLCFILMKVKPQTA